MKDKILKLRSEGKSYREISKLLGCARSTVCYHLGENQKIKHNMRVQKYRGKHPFLSKINTFRESIKLKRTKITTTTNKKLLYTKLYHYLGDSMNSEFSLDDVIKKFGDEPKCYLTGQDIDIYKTNSYHFDHIIPKSRGGDNSLDNLQICTKKANQTKSDMTPDELMILCKQILQHNGYQVTKATKGLEPS